MSSNKYVPVLDKLHQIISLREPVLASEIVSEIQTVIEKMGGVYEADQEFINLSNGFYKTPEDYEEGKPKRKATLTKAPIGAISGNAVVVIEPEDFENFCKKMSKTTGGLIGAFASLEAVIGYRLLITRFSGVVGTDGLPNIAYTAMFANKTEPMPWLYGIPHEINVKVLSVLDDPSMAPEEVVLDAKGVIFNSAELYDSWTRSINPVLPAITEKQWKRYALQNA